MTAPLGAAVDQALGSGIRSVVPLSGGSICDSAKVTLTDGRVVFAKSAAGLPDDLLAVEAECLGWLRAADAVPIPAVLARTDDALILEWIEPGRPSASTEEALGRGLAALHQAGAPRFGWHRDGYIGTVPQSNTPEPDWPAFWMHQRIEPLASRAVATGSFDPAGLGLVDRLGDRIDKLAGPAEPPARLHGDLWSGNVHVDHTGQAWLIDPASYGGCREVDLAMLHLFGSPSPALTGAYHEAHPLADGWQERLRLWQLEPLLVHAVLFGGSYGSSALDILRQFA